MELSKEQTSGFAKIIKRGMEHYRTVPHSLGHFDTASKQDRIGYVIWKDVEANFTTAEGDTNQEFYIKDTGEVCVYKNKTFIPVTFRTKNWNKFCNPNPVGSEIDGN